MQVESNLVSKDLVIDDVSSSVLKVTTSGKLAHVLLAVQRRRAMTSVSRVVHEKQDVISRDLPP